MNTFVRSCQQHDPNDKRGYFWRKSIPPLVSSIEAHSVLTSDYFSVMLLWGEYSSFKGTNLNLYISGLSAGFTDMHNRPLMNTVLWSGDPSEEKILRGIMVEFVKGKLKKQLQQIIHSDSGKGFDYSEDEIAKIGLENYPVMAQADLPRNPIEFHGKSELIETLLKYKLPSFSNSFCMDSPEGLLVAVGKGFSLEQIKATGNHKYLKWVCDFQP